jgi:hypothetical protein
MKFLNYTQFFSDCRDKRDDWAESAKAQKQKAEGRKRKG